MTEHEIEINESKYRPPMKLKLIKEMDDHAQESLYNAAIVVNTSTQEFTKNICKAINEAAITIEKQLELLDVDFPDLDLPRSPEEIKRNIKHEKNPMRLKQLNKELNESYKAYKRK